MELAIQKYLREYGIEKTRTDFSLNVKSIGDSRVLFKYDQIESRPKDHPVVMDARGIILDKDNNWNIISMSFRRFFNYTEAGTELYDFTNARVATKYDGSLISVYYYNGDWYCATSGTIDADTPINDLNITFKELFWNTVQLNSGMTIEEFKYNLVPGYTYIFELCTPDNIVVTPHIDYNVYLLGIRDLSTLLEVDWKEVCTIAKYTLNIKSAETHIMPDTIDELVEYAKQMPFSDEGYVVTNSIFERCKIKSPAYVAAHTLKGKLAAWKIIDIVKSNEIDEYCVLFPNKKDELELLMNKYNSIIEKLDLVYNDLKVKFDNKKDLALYLNKNAKDLGVAEFQTFIFKKFDGNEMNAKQFIYEYNSKRLYELLN